MAGHQLLLRAGMIRQLSTGAYGYLPLGRRVLRKIEHIIREEMEAIEGQELLMPVVSEDVIADLICREVSSYRQLPLVLYHIRTDLNAASRALGRGVVAEAYSLHPNSADWEAFFLRFIQACENVCRRCDLEVISADDLAGRKLIAPLEGGEDSFIRCSKCDYAASIEGAKFAKGRAPVETEKPIEKVATPGCKTIQAVADYVGVPAEKTIKAVFYATEEGEVIFVAIRGDLEVNEAKLKDVLGVEKLRPATEEELDRIGIVAGYASPMGVKGVKVVADDSVKMGSNFVAGANEEGYHLKNVNYARDFGADLLADIALAREGYACPHCGGELIEARGIEVGCLSAPREKHGEAVGAIFLDRDGRAKPIVMGSYGLDMGRMMAAIVEQHHDGKGIIWPPPIAPYHVHLVALGKEAAGKAEELYASLQSEGFEVLYDDRDESAGVKFNDADLMGMPLRLTVSRRTLEKGGVEVKLRHEKVCKTIGFDELYSAIKAGTENRPYGVDGPRSVRISP